MLMCQPFPQKPFTHCFVSTANRSLVGTWMTKADVTWSIAILSTISVTVGIIFGFSPLSCILMRLYKLQMYNADNIRLCWWILVINQLIRACWQLYRKTNTAKIQPNKDLTDFTEHSQINLSWQCTDIIYNIYK